MRTKPEAGPSTSSSSKGMVSSISETDDDEPDSKPVKPGLPRTPIPRASKSAWCKPSEYFSASDNEDEDDKDGEFIPSFNFRPAHLSDYEDDDTVS